MSRFLLVNPLSLSDEDLSELITDLARIKSQRTKLSSVSSLNEICMKKGHVEYDFEKRNRQSRWTCYAHLYIGELYIKSKHQHHEKKIAKEYVSTKILDQLQSRLFVTNSSSKNKDNKREYSDEEYSDCSENGGEVEYDEEYGGEVEYDEEYGSDSLPTSDSHWSWHKMTDEEKKQELDAELDSYIATRGSNKVLDDELALKDKPLRVIPHVTDGLIESQRKIMFNTLNKLNSYSIKVSDLASFVSENTKYEINQ